MIASIFSSFDISIHPSANPNFGYIYGLLPLIMFIQLFWITPSTRWTSFIVISHIGIILTTPTHGKHLKGFKYILTSTFYSIIIINLWGAAPFITTLTSHLITTLRIGAPIWLASIVTSLSNKFKTASAHFLPENAPSFIASFLSLVEALRSYIRPITLSFRLAANISAGHVILGIITAAATTIFLTTLIILILPLPLATGGGYSIFELIICLVQAFVFRLLRAIYSTDYVNLKIK